MKVYFLSSCSTCQRILKEWNLPPEAVRQDIKNEAITAEQLDEMKQLAGSYEALFSRKSLKYRALGLHEKSLTEADYRHWILEEYTFLKRPVLLARGQIFIGNTAAVVQAARQHLEG